MRSSALLPVLVVVAAAGCTSDLPDSEPVEIVIPDGAAFSTVVDTLEARSLVSRPGLFTVYARARGADREIRAGRYLLTAGSSWSTLLDVLTTGRVVPRALTIPEGWTLRQMAPRIAEVSGVPQEAVETLLASDSLAEALSVPGPGLEGYLFPDTYHFAEGVPPSQVVSAMARAYQDFWTPERQARLDSLGMTRTELTTLASIIQAEAAHVEEMPLISGVYHNRLREGWLLQADPTVLYALGGPRERLLYAAIDSVADSPYNTYRQPGLPPGPIGAPGFDALEAALNPAQVPYMFFVVGPDGGHVFSTTMAEHNRAVAEYRRRRSGTSGAP
ncbi:MAG TPA: endolytic transglycosylase MltG [Longimicrobiales bacterium]|nr:endolytic transglycosylase MltG [Longimicrobiales bacterium]